MKLINIGPCSNRKDPTKTGGIVVLFEDWLEYCRTQAIDTVTIDTNKANYTNKLVAYISILWKFIKEVGRCKVIMLHGTANDYLLIAPIVVFISLLCHKKIVLRKFAGNFEDIYVSSNILFKSIYNYVLRHADLLFWETKSLVAFGNKIGSKSYWFPNVRTRQHIKRDLDQPFSYRFVFLSRVEKGKGLDVLKECFSSLPAFYHIDIYGPVKDYEMAELSGINYSYKGVVEPSKVCEVLSEYDVLVLPTLWKSEGYPGIVIEGYNVGIPAVASRIGAIPEIVNDGKTGLLVEPGNVEDLRQAILSIDKKKYIKLSGNALKAFDEFDAEVVNNRILQTVLS